MGESNRVITQAMRLKQEELNQMSTKYDHLLKEMQLNDRDRQGQDEPIENMEGAKPGGPDDIDNGTQWYRDCMSCIICLYTTRYTLYTIHYTLYTIYYILYTIYYILYTLYTLYTLMHNMSCIICLYTTHYTLHTIHYTLYTIYTIHTIHTNA